MKTIRTLFLLTIAALLGACSQIDTGNVGVERTLGKVSGEALPPGVYFTLFKTVDEFTAKEVSFALENLTPKSRDNLTMKDVDIGQADANDIISRSLTPSLERIKLAELQRDAAVAIAGKAGNTVLLGGSGATPLVAVK